MIKVRDFTLKMNRGEAVGYWLLAISHWLQPSIPNPNILNSQPLAVLSVSAVVNFFNDKNESYWPMASDFIRVVNHGVHGEHSELEVK